MARLRGLPRSLRVGLIALALVAGVAGYVWAQGVGIFSRSLCTSLTSPVAGQTFCFEQSTNTLKFYTGAATAPWVNVSATQVGVNNVRDFGAVGDGATDDTTAIINAIGRTYNPSTENGAVQPIRVVYFPPGYFKTTSTIEVPPNVVLRGAGRGSTNITSADLTGSWIFKSANLPAFRLVNRASSPGSLWQMTTIEDLAF